jgi:cell division protein FtsI (penicillin-binding protein 3)/stage V sporulation protein D (sporulation-specific penicillin-binding protein)
VIASGGELLRPQLIREIRDRRGETVYTFGGVARRRVIGPRTAESMARMLQAVVSTEGTAGKIALPGYQLAGKTGTARKLVDGRYSDKNHVASFSGFFPASQPRVVISVVVDDARLPDGADAYGSRVAAPSFQNIARKLISYLDIKPVEDTSMPRAYAALEGGRR